MSIKINIIGFGIMGKNVANALMANPLIKITAVSDLKEKNLSIAKDLGITGTYRAYQEMIDKEKPDAVFVATPDWDHYAAVMDCLDAGIHVHVEKPLTTIESQAAEIVRKARQTGLKVQVAFNHRWLAPYHATFNMIRENKIGNPLIGYARKNSTIAVPTKMIPWAKYSSPMWFLSCHDIDLVSWWINDHAVEVKAYGVKTVLKEKFGWDTYDAMQGIVKFSKGTIITFESAWIYPETHPGLPDSFMEIIGQHGHVHLDRKMEAIEMSSPDGLAWPRSLLNYKVFDHWVGAFPSCVNSFIDAIKNDRQPHVTAYDGWRVTAILDAIHRSADTGQTINLPPLS